MKKIALFAAVAVLAVSGIANAAESTTIVNDRGETVTITGRSVGYNDLHPVNPSSLIPSAFETQLPAALAETIVFNMSHGD